MGSARDGGAGDGGEWGGEVRGGTWVSRHGGFEGEEGDKGIKVWRGKGGGMEDAAGIEDGAGRWTA